MKVLIIVYNRLTLPRAIADWVAERGCEPIFIDNGSDYPPLLKYYGDTKYQVFRMGQNYGHTVVWEPMLNVIEKLGITGRYIVTDPDLDLTGVPNDFLEVMNRGLDLFPEYDKCGLSLEINDLPYTKEGWKVKNTFEAKYWREPLNEHYFKADTDTTFAMYREGVKHYSHSAIRTNRPYTARHIPWYYTNFAALSEEEKYYFHTANESSSGKKRLME